MALVLEQVDERVDVERLRHVGHGLEASGHLGGVMARGEDHHRDIADVGLLELSVADVKSLDGSAE